MLFKAGALCAGASAVTTFLLWLLPRLYEPANGFDASKTAASDRRDPWVVEIVADVNLRHDFGLRDGDGVEIRLRT